MFVHSEGKLDLKLKESSYTLLRMPQPMTPHIGEGDLVRLQAASRQGAWQEALSADTLLAQTPLFVVEILEDMFEALWISIHQAH
jgi:hypothetical protein